MRKKIKKLHNPNFIYSILEFPIYSSTYCHISCDADGPNCEEGIPEDESWGSGWKDIQELSKGHNGWDSYELHACPSCQETNCHECLSNLEEGGRCTNKNCENHEYCKECQEPYFQDMHGSAYCINPECEQNDEIKRKEAAKLATRSYWVDCDGPECEGGEGWYPQHDKQPPGWKRIEHDRNGESTTDYCEDCWDNHVCHYCNEPYDEEERKHSLTSTQVCRNTDCSEFDTCHECNCFVDKNGNCMGDPDGYCSNSGFCRHCEQESVKSGVCLNRDCAVHSNPLEDAFFPKKEAHYTYHDDPAYPEYPVTVQHCDYPGCEETRYPDNPVVYDPMEYVEDSQGKERNYCSTHKNEYCEDCGWSEDNFGRCNNETCYRYSHCPDCNMKNRAGGTGACSNQKCYMYDIPKHHCGACEIPLKGYNGCNNVSCRNFVNPYEGLF